MSQELCNSQNSGLSMYLFPPGACPSRISTRRLTLLSALLCVSLGNAWIDQNGPCAQAQRKPLRGVHALL